MFNHSPKLAMPKWKHEVRLKHLFLNQETNKPLETIGRQIYNILSRHRCFDDFDEKEFFLDIEGQSDFNNTLDLLYDYADKYRIWIH